MRMFDFEMFFGRFHPLIVHIPIGFILLAIVFKGLDIRYDRATYRPAFKVSLFLAAIIAVFTCVTGLLLSWSGTYPDDDLFWHKWAGIGLAVVAIGWYFVEFRWDTEPVIQYIALGLTAGLLLITGHRGGVLTHGETYLWEGMPVAWQQFFGHDPYAAEQLEFEISSLDSALVYEDIVVPILEARCYSCHSDRKQKADLRLDSPDMMRKGGESGDPLITDDLGKRKLYHVLTLPLDEDEHMPPKGKTQLTKYEVEVIGSWVQHGGKKDLMAMQYNDKKALKEWYDDLVSDEKLFSNVLIPAEKASEPDQSLMESLRKKGVLIQPIGKNSHYLEVSFINVPELHPELVQEVTSLKENIIWVDASGKELDDDHLTGLSQLTHITDLNMAGSILPENVIQKLSSLENVQILNLTGADLRGADFAALADWPKLRKVYTFLSSFSSESIGDFMENHPEIMIDTGGYRLPEVPRDTIVYRYEG